MRAVILVKLPNQNRFVGTFDLAGWSEWWLSEPIPGDVAEILSNSHIYGDYHVCLCKMLNGDYAIYLSPDCGKTWELSLRLTETVYSMTLIDPGWMILSTSGGWWETQNTAHDWAKISSQAQGCKKVINIGADILLGHDGRYIWKSLNYGRNWRVVLDCRSFNYYWYHGSYGHYDYSGQLFTEAFDGVYNQVVVGIGNKLFVSDDQGEHWNAPWMFIGGPSYIPDMARSDRLILQVLHTDCWGTTPKDNSWMMRVYRIPEGNVRHWYINDPYAIIGQDMGINQASVNANYIAVFDQVFTGSESGNLVSYDVLRPRSEFKDLIVFSCQSRFNSTRGVYEPSVKYSINGGKTFIDLDVSQFKVYEGNPDDGNFSLGGPFLLDTFTTRTWTGYPCHNYGSYIVTDGKWERAISYDMGYRAKGVVRKEFNLQSRIKKVQSIAVALENVQKKQMEFSYGLSAPNQKQMKKDYQLKSPVQKSFLKRVDLAAKLVQRNRWPYHFESSLTGKNVLKYQFESSATDESSKSYGLATLLVKDMFDWMVLRMEKFSMQEWMLHPENWPTELWNRYTEPIE